jgi:hypothetical protein
MKIMMEDVADVLGEFRQQVKANKNWFAFETNQSQLTAGDFYYFHNKQDERFLGNTLIQLPLTAAIQHIEMSVVTARLNDPLQDHIVLIHADVLNLDKAFHWDYNKLQGQLEERMKAIDWNHAFYDPLEANTEAETAEDITAFNMLEQLVYDLQNIHQSGSEGRQLVDTLTEKYWAGSPMEDQKDELFTGYHQNKDPIAESMVKEKDHPISNEVLDAAQVALINAENWMVYNSSDYLLEAGGVHFFDERYEAEEYAYENSTDYDIYKTLFFTSVEDILRQIPYGQQLRRDPDENPLYNKEGNEFTDALIEHFEQQSFNHTKTKFMNTDNLKYLTDNVKYMGFGDKQNAALEQHLKDGKESFQLTFNTEVNKKPFEAVLNFRKPENSDKYFLNSYHASLERGNGDRKEQTFYLNYGKGVTAKEAFNLLDGRSVEKEITRKMTPEETEKFKGELKLAPEQRGLPENWEKAPTYKAWIQLDFDNKDKNGNYEVNQFHENFGYDLKESLGKYAIAELDGSDKGKALMQSLQKGNVQSIAIGEHKMFVEANPQYKTVTLYDGQMKRMQKESLQQYLSVDKKKDVTQDQKQDVAKDTKQKADKELKNDNKPAMNRSKSRSVSH